MRTCTRCAFAKEISQFGKDSQYKDALTKWCKDCRNAYRKPRSEKEKAGAKRYAKNHPSKSADYKANYPERRAAHVTLNNALRDGRVLKTACFVCGKEKTEAHHAHYDLPLDVIWLCKKHHVECHHEKAWARSPSVMALATEQPQLELEK